VPQELRWSGNGAPNHTSIGNLNGAFSPKSPGHVTPTSPTPYTQVFSPVSASTPRGESPALSIVRGEPGVGGGYGELSTVGRSPVEMEGSHPMNSRIETTRGP
jgi:hypothetical protein